MKDIEDRTILPIVDVDYEYVQLNEELEKESGNPSIKILLGEFANVIAQYGSIQIRENDDPTQAPIVTFKYRIIDAADHDPVKLRNNADFKNRLGDIISGAIVEYFAERLENGNRESGNQEFDH